MKRKKTNKGKPGRGGKNVPPPRAALRQLVRSELFRFAALFGLSCLGFHALICALDHYPAFSMRICEYTAHNMGQVLNALGMSVSTTRNVISGRGLTFTIVLECTALFAMGLFACFVSFYPAEARKKLVGLAAGLPALYLGNVARLVLIFLASSYNPKLFTVVHVYLGQVFTMLLVVLACIIWLRWATGNFSRSRANNAAAFAVRFIVISGCAFFLWMEIHHLYIRLIDWLVAFGFSLFGQRIFFSPLANVYYETFSIVTFFSLVLATGSVKWRKKAKGLALGMALFFSCIFFTGWTTPWCGPSITRASSNWTCFSAT